MKKTIVAAALGIVVSVAPSYGQGQIFFNNYGATTDAIVTWTDGRYGPVGSEFKATLFYQFGGGALTPLGNVTAFNPAIPGYFTGPIVTIPGYTGGPISFQILVYDGPADYASSYHSGRSALFTLPGGIATGQNPVGEFGPALLPFSVSDVPEPSSIALVGLGLVSLLIFRRQRL